MFAYQPTILSHAGKREVYYGHDLGKSGLCCCEYLSLSKQSNCGSSVCRIPAGSELDQALVMYLSGRLTISNVKLSYRQCGRGKYESEEKKCHNCTAGKSAGSSFFL